MALQAKYKEYLANPSAETLADNASLNYVPTTTSLSTPNAILKHLKAQHLQVEKKSEKFLNVIEGTNSICVETETTLHFVQGGGVYLLNLDDNFLNNKTVVLPVTHIVIFNGQQKIQQIRLLWDQACLLKAVETIGARGRNWPIRDGPEQIKMIVSSAAAAPTLASLPDEERTCRSRGVDPHASLKLFAPQSVPVRAESPRNSVAPRASAKPPPREWTELFAGGEEPLGSPERSPSPTKRNRENSNPLKSGAGKHYHESRLFKNEAEQEPTGGILKEKGIKTNNHKYDHFEFGEPEVKPQAVDAPEKPKNKHLSQWDFQDFVTPEKPPARKISHHQPTLKWEPEAEATGQRSPVYLEHVPQPRPDANAHFKFEDETPKPERTVSNRPASSASSGGLYEDHILGAYHTSHNRNTIGNGNGAETDDGQDNLPLKSITNPNQHNKTFSSHWDMTDASPSKYGAANDENLHVPGGEKGHPPARSQDRHYDLFDDSPAHAAQQHQGIKIQGDGMGKKMQGEKSWWEYDEQ